jgi:hypothetical protein
MTRIWPSLIKQKKPTFPEKQKAKPPSSSPISLSFPLSPRIVNITRRKEEEEEEIHN